MTIAVVLIFTTFTLEQLKIKNLVKFFLIFNSNLRNTYFGIFVYTHGVYLLCMHNTFKYIIDYCNVSKNDFIKLSFFNLLMAYYKNAKNNDEIKIT